MSNMFNDAKLFNQSISSWNIQATTDVRDMFKGATLYNTSRTTTVGATTTANPTTTVTPTT
jgi:hypothetical protein